MENKSLSEYNAKDLFELFSYLYKQKYGIDYEIPKTSFIGHEFHLLRVAIDENGAEQIVCATVNCIDTNDKTVSIPYFIAGLKYYLTQYNPYIYFAVKRFGNDDIKKLWRQFIYLDSIWFPKGSQKKQKDEAFKKLKTCAYEKVNKKKRKINTKKSLKRKL